MKYALKLIPGILILLAGCTNQPEIKKETWREKPFNEWPSFALTNTVGFEDTTYTDIANSFLVETSKDTIAVTCKHIFLVFSDIGLTTIDLGKSFRSWNMHIKTKNEKSVEITSLINRNDKEKIGAFNTLKDRDWIIFSVKNKNTDIYPLKIRTEPLKQGEIVHAVGWAYWQKTEEPSLIKMQQFKNMGNYYYVTTFDNNIDPAGRSGSPVIDKNGYLVGLVSGAEGKLGVIGSVTYLLKLFNQYGIQYEKQGP